jgi:hypothetical protein
MEAPFEASRDPAGIAASDTRGILGSNSRSMRSVPVVGVGHEREFFVLDLAD